MAPSHETYHSSKDERGNCVWLSIDFSTKFKRHDISIYEGMAFNTTVGWADPKHREVMLAKFFNNTSIRCSTRIISEEVEKIRIARNAVTKFNELLRHKWGYIVAQLKQENSEFYEFWDLYQSLHENGFKIRFDSVQSAVLSSVTWLDGTRTKNESLLIMRKMKNFETYTDSCKQYTPPPECKRLAKVRRLFSKRPKSESESSSSARNFSSSSDFHGFNNRKLPKGHCKRNRSHSHGELEDYPCQESDILDKAQRRYCYTQLDILHAFVHYFSFLHNDNMVIDSLQGEYDKENGFILSVPVIHTVNRRFCHRDEGCAGISRVMDKHMCSKLCRYLCLNTHPTINTDNGYEHGFDVTHNEKTWFLEGS